MEENISIYSGLNYNMNLEFVENRILLPDLRFQSRK